MLPCARWLQFQDVAGRGEGDANGGREEGELGIMMIGGSNL